MEIPKHLIEPLWERVEQYSKTSFELLKLKSLDKSAEITSGIISRLILVTVISFFAFTLNIGIALWLGDLLGKSYYGFLAVASFYGLISIVLLFVHSHIKARISNKIITQLLN